jgi:centractin
MDGELFLNQPLVIDNGSAVIKAGLAGEETPQVIMPNMVGRPKHQKVMMTTHD